MLRKKRYWIVLIMLLILSFLPFISMRKSDKQVLTDFSKEGQFPQIGYFKNENKSMRYIMAKDFDASLPSVVFIHGAPGSSSDYFNFLQDKSLKKEANLIAIDRLGYGYSDYGNAETSIEKQATIINNFITSLSTKKTVLVGWSFGGPIAVKIAINNPKISSLLLLAPAIDPQLEKHFYTGYLVKWKTTRWLVPTEFKVAEQEKLAHSNELKKMASDWAKIQIPIIHIHGTKDKLVPFENLAFSKRMISKAYLTPITIDDGSHLIPWKNYDLVVRNIEFLLKNQ